MGAPDPRLDSHGRIDFRISRMQRAFLKEDPPPERAKPLPISLLIKAAAHAYDTPYSSPLNQAVVDMMCLAFYFLMRPGEYCSTPNEAHPFRLQDVQLFAGRHDLPLLLCPNSQLFAATQVFLTFTTQKNSEKGEKICQGRSGHKLFCPVLAVARRVTYLRSQDASPDISLHMFRLSHTSPWQPVRSSDITTYLRSVVDLFGQNQGYDKSLISARSLRPSGAMALLVAKIDPNTIQLLGRWKSDSMLRYLHVDALSSNQNHAASMLTDGDFTPNSTAP